MPKTIQSYAASLRAVADFIEANEYHFPIPLPISIASFMHEAEEEQKSHMLESRQRMGKVGKNAFDTNFYLSKDFGNGVFFEAWYNRSAVCEQVITTRQIDATPETVIPATEARIEQVVEWVCPKSIMDEVGA